LLKFLSISMLLNPDPHYRSITVESCRSGSTTLLFPTINDMISVFNALANLSKAAWGSMNKAGDSCHIMSYEAGVLFLPKYISGGWMVILQSLTFFVQRKLTGREQRVVERLFIFSWVAFFTQLGDTIFKIFCTKFASHLNGFRSKPGSW
jgi:hypothetical protein